MLPFVVHLLVGLDSGSVLHPAILLGGLGGRPMKESLPLHTFSTFSTAAAVAAASEDGAGMAGGGRPEPAQAISMLEIGTRRIIFNEEKRRLLP